MIGVLWAALAWADVPYAGPDLCTPEIQCPPGLVVALCDAQPTDRSRCTALEQKGFVKLCREQGGWRWWQERYCGPADAGVEPAPALSPTTAPSEAAAPRFGACASGPEGFPAVLVGIALLLGLRWRERPVVA